MASSLQASSHSAIKSRRGPRLTVLRPSVPGASQRVIPSCELSDSKNGWPHLKTYVMFTGWYEKGRSRFLEQSYHVMGIEGHCFPRVEKVVVRSIFVHLFVMFRGREAREPNSVEIPFRIRSTRVARVSIPSRDKCNDGPG